MSARNRERIQTPYFSVETYSYSSSEDIFKIISSNTIHVNTFFELCLCGVHAMLTMFGDVYTVVLDRVGSTQILL